MDRALPAAVCLEPEMDALKVAGKTDTLVALLTELVDRYGALSDKLLAYDLARDEGDEDKADAIGEEVDGLWDELCDWQSTEDVGNSFDALRDRLKGVH